MAQVSASPSGKGGRRSYDANINLIPYIDLMTTIITFLMMTAVWTQIATLEIQNGADETAVPVEEANPPKLIHVFMTAKGLGVYEEGGVPVELPNVNSELDLPGLSTQLSQLKKERPDRGEISLGVDDGVVHGRIIKVIDLATKVGFLSITMKPLSMG